MAYDSRNNTSVEAQLYTAQNERDYTIRIEEDTYNCFISGCCQMPDGIILLADNRNRKLKQLDSSYQVTNHCDLPSRPYTVCCISGQEVAVSADFKIYFVSVSRGIMAVTRSIETNHPCWGLAYNNGQLFVSDFSNKVYIYNLSGTCLRTLDKDSNGVAMFSETRHIAVSHDRTKIHVADENIGLVTLTTDGQLLSTFHEKDLNGASGVCVDGRGSVLVSNWNPRRVIQMDENGKRKLGTVVPIMKSKSGYPASICFDRQNYRLMVTMSECFCHDSVIAFDMQCKTENVSR